MAEEVEEVEVEEEDGDEDEGKWEAEEVSLVDMAEAQDNSC